MLQVFVFGEFDICYFFEFLFSGANDMGLEVRQPNPRAYSVWPWVTFSPFLSLAWFPSSTPSSFHQLVWGSWCHVWIHHFYCCWNKHLTGNLRWGVRVYLADCSRVQSIMVGRHGNCGVRQLLTFRLQSGSREMNAALSSLSPCYSMGNWWLLLKLAGSDSGSKETLPVASKTPLKLPVLGQGGSLTL